MSSHFAYHHKIFICHSSKNISVSQFFCTSLNTNAAKLYRSQKVQVIQCVIAPATIIYVIFFNFQKSKSRNIIQKNYLVPYQKLFMGVCCMTFKKTCSYQQIIDISEK